MNSNRHRVVLTAAILALVVAGCKKQNNSSPAAEAPEPPKALATPAKLNTRIYLTGLLLIVPPKKVGETNVLLPKRDNHVALLGIGFQKGNPPSTRDFCLNDTTQPAAPKNAIKEGKCYVNLAKWDLAPIGGLPASTAKVDLETNFGVLNVSRGSAGGKVVLNSIEHLLTSRVVFNAGAPADDCKLGKWTYKPNQSGNTFDVASVLMWDITLPSNYQFVFTRKETPHDTVKMSLVPDPSTNRVELVLAQLPSGEVADLPPTPAGKPNVTKPDSNSAAPDFNVFYDLVGISDPTPDSGRRPLPHFKDEVQNPFGCRVDISSFTSRADTSAFGVKTFLCIPASADAGP